MQFSILSPSHLRTLLHTLLGGWLGRSISSPHGGPNSAPSAIGAQNSDANPGTLLQSHGPGQHAHGVSTSLTPIEWLAGLPCDMSLVISIDQPTCQIMEMVAMSRKQAAEYLRTPIYTDHQTRWQSLGQNRLRRTDFAPAIAFQQQEDALNELESLFSARWHATTELLNVDQSILQAYEAVFPTSTSLAEEPKSDTQTLNPSAISALKDLLCSRKIVSDELARLDEAGIPALQKLGMPLPQVMPAVGQIPSSI